jgi:hypothetical protein
MRALDQAARQLRLSQRGDALRLKKPRTPHADAEEPLHFAAPDKEWLDFHRLRTLVRSLVRSAELGDEFDLGVPSCWRPSSSKSELPMCV